MRTRTATPKLFEQSGEPRPVIRTLKALRVAESDCNRCPLYKIARVVSGEGRPGSSLMLVGEQPGDREDLAVVVRFGGVASIATILGNIRC